MVNINLPGLVEQTSKLASSIATTKSKSMVEYTGATRITPLTIVDRSLLAVPELQDGLQVLASLDAAYQMMGIQLTVNSIDGISIIRQLEKLNPNRASAGQTAARMASKYALSRENYQYRLPTGKELKKLNYPTTLAQESTGQTPPPPRDRNGPPPTTETQNQVNSEMGRGTIDTIMQDSSLAVGKLMEVNVTVNGNRFTIPCQVRLNTFTATPTDIASIVANIDPHQSAGEVKALYQAGLINLWDALTGKSAANEWRRAAMKDKTGVIMKEHSRRSNNKMQSFLTQTPSFGDISSIYVISANTAREVEGIIGGKLSNFKTREKMLEKTGVMLLAVMDPSWKMMTIYHHSIDSESSYSFSDLKRGGKSNSHDMGMVLEAFRQGQAPAKFF